MKRILLALLLMVAMCVPSMAQVVYGSLTGIIRDSAGAVIPGASAKLVNAGTAQEFTAQTNDVGSYTFLNLPPGTYELTIGASGFRTLAQRDIVITVNTVRREDLALEIATPSSPASPARRAGTSRR